MTSSTLNTNSLAFIALCNEYCVDVERASESTLPDFISAMVKILPRLYIAASDLTIDPGCDDDTDINPTLDEEYYDSIRRSMENLLGANDAFLEVFEDDMQYSDTPIAASISECLADIFQSCYNFVEMIREAPDHIVHGALQTMKEDFRTYWSRILCNVMRPLNRLHNDCQNSEENF